MYFLISFCLCLIGASVFAAQSPLPIPPGFLFKGDPIQPKCISHFMGENSFNPLSLVADPCQKLQTKFDADKLREGFLGYPLERASYIYYKYLGPVHFQALEKPIYHLLYVKWSGGGTGQFHAVDIIEKNEDSLRLVAELDGGDRCNGGLSEVAFKEGILTYKKNVTPAALYALGQNQQMGENNFSDCAICCIGTVVYKNGALAGFEIDAEEIHRLGGDKGDSPQECYNKVMKETFIAGKTSLTPEELNTFTQKIKNRCLL